MSKLILMRHGQSKWNLLNLFTGWVDVPLTSLGIEEALNGGEQIKNEPIDIIFTSTLIRAQMTALLAMSKHHSQKIPIMTHYEQKYLEKSSHIYSEDADAHVIPVIPAWELNERMYGELQGLNKKEVAEKYGAEQVKIWRRSFDIPPPGGESLQMTAARVLPYFEQTILPHIQAGKNIFLVAHGNSLRAIMMKLNQLSPEEVVHLELATGVPITYQFINDQFIQEPHSL